MKSLQFKKTDVVGNINSFIVIFLFQLFVITSIAQVGINTTEPKGTLDITSINNTGLVLPRVASIEAVTDGNGNPPLNGTTVYDISRNTTCFYQNGSWICIGTDTNGDPILIDENPTTTFNPSSNIDYIKASNTGFFDLFGQSIALSNDGTTLVVGAYLEDSNAMGVDGNQTDNSVDNSGAIYVFIRTGNTWTQQAYIKSSNPEINDIFGTSLSLSNDGNTLVIGAIGEDSNAMGIDGNQTDNSASNSGAAYIFIRTGTVWMQQAYLKASNTDSNDGFGSRLMLSGDGNTLAVSATGEDSNATGVNGNEADNSQNQTGAVYVFIRIGNTWMQQAYIKASNPNNADQYGYSIALSNNGNTLAIGANNESSNATGVNGNEADNSSNASGAVYVYTRASNIWTQQAYIKASNTDANDRFGTSVTLSGNGDTLAVGSYAEDSITAGINGNQTDNSVIDSGAVYIFDRVGNTWIQLAYVKASNTENNDQFGYAVTLSTDGNTLGVGGGAPPFFGNASTDDSNATGINGNQTNNLAINSGSAYIFKRTGYNWTQEAYIKATNTETDDFFGYSITLSGDGNTFAAAAYYEDSNATGINGNQADNSALNSGAVYVYTTN